MKKLHACKEFVISYTQFNTQGSLANSREHLFRIKKGSDPLRKSQPVQSGPGKDNGIIFTFIKFTQPGIQIAAQVFDVQIRTKAGQLCLTPQAGSPNDRSPGQVVHTCIVKRDKGILGNFPCRHYGHMKSGGQIGGHVLHGVDGKIDPLIQQGIFDFLDKQPLAADLGQGYIQDFITLGGYLDQFHPGVGILLFNPVFHPGRLGNSQQAGPGADLY